MEVNGMDVFIPENIEVLIRRLEQNGFEAYIVGGCVRDQLLGRTPKDYDITTSALPDEIKHCFSEYTTIDTGIKHGTVTVVSESENVEVTTFRVDGKYSDHRHPESVTFSRNISDDLSRRDLTINAMAYNRKTGLIDPFGGQNDLSLGKIRCVGEPHLRFEEDALRIMRTLRFASELDFEIDEAAAAAVHDMKALLENVSYERLSKELMLLVTGKSPCKILELYSDVLSMMIPEIAPCVGFDQRSKYHAYDVWSHIAHAVENSAAIPEVRLALLFHDIGKPKCFTVDDSGAGHFRDHERIGAEIAEKILRRMHFSNDTTCRISKLVKFHYIVPNNEQKFVRRLLSKVGAEDFFPLMEVMKGDNSAKHSFCLERISVIDSMQETARKIIEEDQCLKVTDLAVSGYDMMELGLSGAEIGKTLNALLEAVLNEETENTRESLISRACGMIGEKIKKN